MVCSFWSTPHSYRQGAGLIIPSDTFKGHGLRVSSPTESTFLFTPESRGFLDLIPPELSNLSINGMISNLRIYIYISSHSIHPGFPRLPQASPGFSPLPPRWRWSPACPSQRYECRPECSARPKWTWHRPGCSPGRTRESHGENPKVADFRRWFHCKVVPPR